MSVAHLSTEALLANAAAFTAAAADYVMRHESDWAVDANADIEVVNHVFRVLIHLRQTRDQQHHFLHLAEFQNSDGGWGQHPSDETSGVRPTGFTTQILARANREIGSSKLTDAANKGLMYLLDSQRENGAWDDARWNTTNATSMAVGTLMFFRDDERVRGALDSGMRYIQNLPRRGSLWQYPPGQTSVEVTAHFVQKLIPYDADPALISSTIDALIRAQGVDGSWDNGDVDATCDVTRALLLAGSHRAGGIATQFVRDRATVGFHWLLSTASTEGIGARPGMPPNVLHTADAIDTALKFQDAVASEGDLVHLYR
jgi:squalene cyclase